MSHAPLCLKSGSKELDKMGAVNRTKMAAERRLQRLEKINGEARPRTPMHIGSDDPGISATQCKLPIDGVEFRKYETRARQDASYDSCKQGMRLRRQANLLVK